MGVFRKDKFWVGVFGGKQGLIPFDVVEDAAEKKVEGGRLCLRDTCVTQALCSNQRRSGRWPSARRSRLSLERYVQHYTR